LYHFLGATNDTINNRSILNGGVRARMRLHSSENLTPSIYRGLTNIHLSPNYNGGNSQASSSKNVGFSTTISSADSTLSGNISSSASNSNLSTSILVNGHVIPMTDKSISPGNRHATDIRTFAGRLTIKELSSANPTESRSYTWSNHSNTDQSAIVKSDLCGPPQSEQSPSMISGQQICTDVHGISRQDQSILPSIDSSSASQTDVNASSHIDTCGGASALEQSVVAAPLDGRVMARLEQLVNNIPLNPDDLLCPRQLDQPANIRRMSMTNEDQRMMRQSEQSTNICMAEDVRGMRKSEQSTNVCVNEDLRTIRQQSEQSTSVRPQEELRTLHAEQSLNTAPLLDFCGVSRGQQNASVPLTDNRVVFRSEQSAVIPLSDGRAIPIVEHMSPVVLSDSRSSVPRIPQTAVSLSNQSAASMPGQSVTQPGSSIVLTEDINHSEEPLPPGWEMRYDLYGRR